MVLFSDAGLRKHGGGVYAATRSCRRDSAWRARWQVTVEDALVFSRVLIRTVIKTGGQPGSVLRQRWRRWWRWRKMIVFLSTIPTASRKTRCVVSAASPNRSVTTGEDGDDFRQRLGYPRSPAKAPCQQTSCTASIVEYAVLQQLDETLLIHEIPWPMIET
ncbi:hypothetical protein G5I_10848 [Acromyrmex echinatior]|uniref:Uncharacterized protein n=1 Tax=Acromyrmex echinatior TaxID=103372 RepID=F4WXZ2_ACREC|nr:hypothetical protein G5I_10848 [Acromyrmex echinatior]